MGFGERRRRSLPLALVAIMFGELAWGGTPARALDALMAWTPALGATGYKVYVRQSSAPYGAGTDVGLIAADPDGQVRHVVTGLPRNVTNSFVVTAYNATGESAFSNELTLRVDDTPTPRSTATATSTGAPTATRTASTISTATTAPSPTFTPTKAPTRTFTASASPTATATAIPSLTASATSTAVPTATGTPVATATASATRTRTATRTPTPTATASATAMPSPTRTPTRTFTRTATRTFTPTATPTPPTGTPVSTPESIPNLVLWLDAGALALSDGQPVPAWTDRRDVGWVAAQSQPGSQPLFRVGVVNGMPAVRFDGLDDYLTISGSIVPGSRERTIFIVARPDVVDNNGIIDLGDGSTPGSAFMVTPEIAVRVNGGNQLWRDRMWTNAPTLTAVLLDGPTTDNVSAWLNGAALSPGASTSRAIDTAGGATIGGYTAEPTGYHSFAGDLAEIIVYDRALSPQERARLDAYLAAKYALPPAPSTLPGLRLWLDAGALAGTVDGTAVAAWADRTSAGWVASQSTAASQPTYSANGFNGRPAVHFDGLDDYLSIGATLIPGSQSRTVAVVVRSELVANKSIIDLGDGAAPGAAFMLTPELGARISGGNRLWQAAAAPGAPLVGLVVLDGPSTADLSAWINGSALDGASIDLALVDTQGGATIGGYTAAPTGYHSFAGDIAEIVVYDAALDASARQTLERYLAAKYDITLGVVPGR